MLPAYQINPMLDFSPVSKALTGYQNQMMKNDQLGLEDRQVSLREKEYGDNQKQKDIERVGRAAKMFLEMPANDPRRPAIGAGLLRLHPNMPGELQKAGIDANDHDTVARFLQSQTSGYDPLGEKFKQSQIEENQAKSAYYRGRASIDQKERWKLDPNRNVMVNSITGETRPIYAGNNPASVDPLAGAGLDDDGNLVKPGQAGGAQSFSHPAPNYVPQTGQTGAVPPPPMRLGGPIDDIDRSMLPDEGRGPRPQGVQVAQAGGPSIVDTARMSPFGPAGRTSPEIPGVVTDAGRNRRVDVPATREMQGQRAYDAASPDQQQRLMKFRQDQEMWTGVYKRQPRAGYYYGEDGREMPLTDKNFKGDRESQAVALMNMNKVEQASKKLTDYNWASRTALGAMNVGEVGQAFADMKQGALGIAYALSGKTVAVAEMKNFIEAYGPVPGDSAERIQNKTQRMRDFYQALLTASRGGESYEKAFARAMASTGLKNPDGGPAGAPAVAGSTSMPPPGNPGAGLSGVSTEELVRRLSGGR